ncbi:MAG: class SAM-dependent methyltransferase [Aeromicrobium sp.]|nr:class SAM-dependent methyltransferase [Aeromicrobium sp.]
MLTTAARCSTEPTAMSAGRIAMIGRSVSTGDACPICAHHTHDVCAYEVRGGHRAELLRCEHCSFTFVADPHWLPGTFNANLNRLDVGSVDRSLLVSSFVRGLLGRYSRRSTWKVLDVGGGDGLFTRVLRDHGLDCRWTDPYCAPVYDVGPAVSATDHFDLAVMGEVALHLEDPLSSFRDVLRSADRLLFTAVVPPVPMSTAWWYLMPSTGQHVSFYPLSSIEEIASQLGVQWCSDGKFFHLLSTVPIEASLRRRIGKRELGLLNGQLMALADLVDRARGKRRSLTEHDQHVAEAAIAGKAPTSNV